MAIGNKSGIKQYQLQTPHRRHISKAAARGHKKGVADQCFADPRIREYIMQKVARLIHSEMKMLCSVEVNSVLQRDCNAMKEFKWKVFISEIECTAPLMYQILMACTKTKQPRSNRVAAIGMCFAILLKYRYCRMNLVHKIIALLLYAGHSGKQVRKMFL